MKIQSTFWAATFFWIAAFLFWGLDRQFELIRNGTDHWLWLVLFGTVSLWSIHRGLNHLVQAIKAEPVVEPSAAIKNIINKAY